MREAEFSKVVHHFFIGVFWILFFVVAIGQSMPSFDLKKNLEGIPQPPDQIMIIENNTGRNVCYTFFEFDTLGNWELAYPATGIGIDGLHDLAKGERDAYYLPADSSQKLIAIQEVNASYPVPAGKAPQLIMTAFPYRKHYVFGQEMAKNITTRISPPMIKQWGLLLLGVASILAIVYHGLRRRKKISHIAAISSALLLVLLYSSYLLYHTVPILWYLWL